MNFTGGNTLPNIGRRINWQLVMLAGGLAVAVAAGAIAGAFERESSPATTAVSQPQAPAAVPAPIVAAAGESTSLTYLLVGSQAEATTLLSAFSAEAAASPELAGQVARISVVPLETAADEAEFMEIVALNTDLHVVDLRTPASVLPWNGGQAVDVRAAPIVYLVASEVEKVALEQQFRELGAWGDTTPRSVFALEGPDADRLYNTILGDQMEHGSFQIVDLRP